MALAGIALLSALAPSLVTVVDSGYDLRPYPTDKVYKVRVADRVTLYVDGESEHVGPDLVTGMALVALATACAMALAILHAARSRRRLLLFYGVSFAALALLAVDELAGIHETVGHNLPGVASLPGVDRPDDLIFLLYVVPAIAYAAAFRDVLTESPLATRLFAASIALLLLSGIADVAGLPVDDALEVLVAGAGASGFVVLLVGHVSAVIVRPEIDVASAARRH